MARVHNGAVLIHLAAEMGWKLSDAEEVALVALDWIAFEGSLQDLQEREFRDLVDFAVRAARGAEDRS
ncbi:MAG: hypothetical protein HY690_12160 [Chloroflexi bacterium]|nr:hypothetical protein [Chloroflexota bacterium]